MAEGRFFHSFSHFVTIDFLSMLISNLQFVPISETFAHLKTKKNQFRKPWVNWATPSRRHPNPMPRSCSTLRGIWFEFFIYFFSEIQVLAHISFFLGIFSLKYCFRAKSPLQPMESEELIQKFTRPKEELYEKLSYVRINFFLDLFYLYYIYCFYIGWDAKAVVRGNETAVCGTEGWKDESLWAHQGTTADGSPETGAD